MAGSRQQVPERFAELYDGYAAALERAPLDADTRRAYGARVRSYLAWLDTAETPGADPLTDPHGRDFAARDYRTFMKTAARRAPSTVNAHLAAIDHFYGHLGLGPALVRRDQLPRRAPRALDARQQKRYLRAVEARPLPRDRAIGKLLYYAGLRISELTALDVDDVPLSARKGNVIVRSGKGGNSREVPLIDQAARTAVADWKTERASWPGADTPALFLNRRGGRLTTRSVDQLLDELADTADLVGEDGRPAASAHNVRHTFGTNLLRGGQVDIVTVAELMGHGRLDTTRLYTLPRIEDIEAAVATLPTDS